METKNNLPVVGSKIEVDGIGRVFCSRAENGTLAFLAMNKDGSISRYEVERDKIKLEGEQYSFDEASEKRLYRGEGDFVRLYRKLRSAKL